MEQISFTRDGWGQGGGTEFPKVIFAQIHPKCINNCLQNSIDVFKRFDAILVRTIINFGIQHTSKINSKTIQTIIAFLLIFSIILELDVYSFWIHLGFHLAPKIYPKLIQAALGAQGAPKSVPQSQRVPRGFQNGETPQIGIPDNPRTPKKEPGPWISN